MRKTFIPFMLTAFATSAVAWANNSQSPGQASNAEDTYQYRDDASTSNTSPDVSQKSGQVDQTQMNQSGQPGTMGDSSMTSTAEAQDMTSGAIGKEKLAIKPQVGTMAFTDQFGQGTARAAYGFTIESNIASMVNENWNNVYIGPVLGLIYSHLGDPNSNFFGADSSSNVGAAGANMLLLPVNLKAGYNITNGFRIAAHGGGNVMYRSVASSFFTGQSSNGDGSVWRIYPNVGGDAEIGLGKNLALMLRPDVTLTPGNSLFTGTVALNIPIA